jgi:hypothetical protein
MTNADKASGSGGRIRARNVPRWNPGERSGFDGINRSNGAAIGSFTFGEKGNDRANLLDAPHAQAKRRNGSRAQ